MGVKNNYSYTILRFFVSMMKKKSEQNHSGDEPKTVSTHRNALFPPRPEVDAKANPHMASSIDRLKDFDSSKQNLWLQYSRQVIDEFCNALPDFPQVKPTVRNDIRCPEEVLLTKSGCAYAFLASKRRDIAKALKHGPLRHQFGLFNKPGFASTDTFNLSKDIPSQKDKIYEQIAVLTSQSHSWITVKTKNKEADNLSIYTITFHLKPDEKKRLHSKNLASSTPFIEDETVLTITFNDYGRDDDRTAIIIDHCPTPFGEDYTSDSSYFKVQFELIDPIFEACQAWDPSDDVHQFLLDAGKLAYLLARMQPVGRGNSAVVEWMIRGLAKANNIELGLFNQNEKIGWDFKAFLTADIGEYAKWFANKAFEYSAVHQGNQFSAKP